MTIFRCFRGWQRYLHEKLALRQRNEELFQYFAGFQVESALQKWQQNTKRIRQQQELEEKANEFLLSKLRCRYFDAWILFGYHIKEKKLKYQLAQNHANSHSIFNRFQRWLQYTYKRSQSKQAKLHFQSNLLHKTWIYWYEDLLSD